MQEHVTESHIYDTLYPRVETALSNATNRHKLIVTIQKYADKWSSILLSTNFSERMLFSQQDRENLYHVCGLTEQDITDTIKDSIIIKSQWKVANNPFYVLSILCMHYFLVNNMQNEFQAVSLYFSYPLFISSSFASFKFVPNKEIMEYTINNLSNRFIIKQEGTIQGMLEYTVMNALEGRYTEELKRCTDADIKDVIYAIEVRISFNIKNIAEEFYKNHKNEKFLFTQSNSYDEEDFHIADNVSYAISRVANATTISIVSSGFDYDKIVNRACSINAGASPKKIKSMLETIVDQDRTSINSFIVDVISLYIYRGSGHAVQDLKTLKFMSEALQIFKSNAQDEITTRIKDKLLNWIKITSEKYGRTFISKGKTSLDTYKRTLFTCFIFKIIEVAKGGA